MGKREGLNSILPYLPLSFTPSSGLFWPPEIVKRLEIITLGPYRSGVTSGFILYKAIYTLRGCIPQISTNDNLDITSCYGYTNFFDKLISLQDAAKWFGKVIPAIARLVLWLPSLLESHYDYTDIITTISGDRAITGLRLIESQMTGIVFLSQELIAAFLGCSFFCLYPIADRDSKHLPSINFDNLFASVSGPNKEYMEHKVRCIMNYFERVCSSKPTGTVSFERKVLSLDFCDDDVGYPKADYWANSMLPLCKFEAYEFGLIEDQARGALEVDFSGQYYGSAALHSGCRQEEIRFMINPELIVGMLFFPAMNHNEAIEIVGAERYSDYTGFGLTFRFNGDHVDQRELDLMGRRKTSIIAIDASCIPGMKQYCRGFLIREVNKAFCGFRDGFKYEPNQENDICTPSTSLGVQRKDKGKRKVFDFDLNIDESMVNKSEVYDLENDESISSGIATGNWGCGAFQGDPELKVMIQWLAASQAKRPFILYYTFGLSELRNIETICNRIISNGWSVGQLWSVIVEYSCKRLDGRILEGFLKWFIPPPFAQRRLPCN